MSGTLASTVPKTASVWLNTFTVVATEPPENLSELGLITESIPDIVVS